MFMIEPLRNLRTTESQLTGAISDIKNRERMFGGNFASNGEGAFSRSRDRTTSLVTDNQVTSTSAKVQMHAGELTSRWK